MSVARYDRALNSALEESLQVGGRLAFLLHDISDWCDDPYELDIQLREKNKIMYYRGTTRLLVVTLSPRDDGTPTFKVTADKFYTQNPSCSDAFGQLTVLGQTSPVDALIPFQTYLSAAIRIAPESHYDNHAEGYWQNRICHRFGRCSRPEDEWLVFDRECVIGFKDQSHKKAALEPICTRYGKARQAIQDSGDDRWRQTHESKGFGDELDMLAINRSGQLLAIELKYGTNASGIYWGPVQVGVYSDAFSLLIDQLAPGVVGLIRQKVVLGLLPAHALSRLPSNGFERVLPVLAIADANPRSRCWPRLAEVMTHAGLVDVVTVGGAENGQVELPEIPSTHIVAGD